MKDLADYYISSENKNIVKYLSQIRPERVSKAFNVAVFKTEQGQWLSL